MGKLKGNREEETTIYIGSVAIVKNTSITESGKDSNTIGSKVGGKKAEAKIGNNSLTESP